MSAIPQETLQFNVSAEQKRQMETEARHLNLSLGAYVMYLRARLQPGSDPVRFDRIVREVFGKHGEVMRKLAQ